MTQVNGEGNKSMQSYAVRDVPLGWFWQDQPVSSGFDGNLPGAGCTEVQFVATISDYLFRSI